MRTRAATNMKLLARFSFSPIPSIGLLALLIPIFLVLLSQQSFAISNPVNFTRYNGQVSSSRLARVHGHLDKINKQSLFTIQSPDGDIIDCVHRRKQPAFDHPLLKNHKIQRVPPEMPKSNKMVKINGASVSDTKNSNISAPEIRQMWHENGKRCPKGTVPIRRSSVHDVLRAKSLYDYGKKQSKYMPATARQFEPPIVVSRNGHEHAIAYTTRPSGVYGAKATINVWNPSIEAANEFSLAQIWVLSNASTEDLNSIEAGWQVHPKLYGDNQPRLFIYWTRDGYQSTGCYNLVCSGFIQTNNQIAIGATISPVSSVGGNQFDVTILIWKDPKSGNWWLRYNDNTIVGYWPAQLFTHLADRATTIEWGGEVTNSRPNGVHTKTQMGSGHFAEDGYGKASYFRTLEVVNSDNSISSARDVSTVAKSNNCYNIKNSYNNDVWGSYFFFGGPGNNPNCS